MKKFEGWVIAAWGLMVGYSDCARTWLIYLSLFLVLIQIILRLLDFLRRCRRYRPGL